MTTKPQALTAEQEARLRTALVDCRPHIDHVAPSNVIALLATIDALRARLAAAEDRAKKDAEDIETMQAVLDTLSYATVGPATMDNLGEAGRNEVEMRIEIADKARKKCHCWREAEKQADQDQAEDDRRAAEIATQP